MVTRIRRSRVDAPDTAKIEALMKSIANSQSLLEKEAKAVKEATNELYSLMKLAKKTVHVVGDVTATLFRSAGRATNTIDPRKFRKLVTDDKEFYSCVSISTTEAKKVLPEKQLATITTTKAAVPGEETVKVTRG